MMQAESQSIPKQLLEMHLKNIQRFRKGLEISQNWQPKVGQTPHEVVLQEGKVRLLHYKSQTRKTYKIPLLIVFSLINRSYVLDLKPGKSIVEKLVQAGFDVYLIDWGIVGAGDQFLTLDDYINRYMYRIVEFIKEHAEVEQLSVLGYCMGGTMAAMYAALYPENVKNLLLMAAPIAYGNKGGLLELWADKQHFNVDKLVSAMGNIPPWFLQSSFNLLKPVQNMVDKYVKFYEKLEDEAFVDDFLTLEYWLNDNIPLAGPVYKQFVEDFFHKNLLVQNKLRLGDHPVNLKNIHCPVLTILAEHDHLVPPAASTPINDAVSSEEKEVIAFPSGHIGLSVSGRAMKVLWPKVAEWLGKRSS
ncbi:MAG TPA: class III poly(R)-hydroxyalkanoic acid synthase subunit PhaC [Coleofasciculaceae cyanobacterium]|jgi:polyhydroxyalkanoate synthase